MTLNQTDLIAILGKRGSGKSNLCKFLQRAFHRVIVIDLLHEYKEKAPSITVTNVPDLARTLIRLIQAGAPKFRIIFKWDVESSTFNEDEFNTVLRLVYKMGDVMLVIEEIHHYMKREYMPEWLSKLVLVGRHQRVGIIATSQKPATVSKVFISQCHHIFVSKMFERNDLKYFADTMGEQSEKLRDLGKHVFAHYVPGNPLTFIKAPKVS